MADERRKKELHNLYDKGISNFDNQLPTANFREQIISAVDRSSTVIIHGATGCGKTTQIPQYILDSCIKKGKPCNIVVTQPRRIAAISVACRVCEEHGWELGGIVGYQIGQDAKISDDTRIVYCTLGIFLQQVIRDKNLDRFTHILLDEIHEREEEMDLALLLIKRLREAKVKGGRVPKLIVMSATMDMLKLQAYLGQPPVIGINVGMYPVEEKYLDDLPFISCVDAFNKEDPFMQPIVQDGVVKLMLYLDEQEGQRGRGSVLIFAPGIHEIKSIIIALAAQSKRANADWEVLPLHSTIGTPEQQQIFLPVSDRKRRIIVASNIAESSITVPDVRYIVDLCLTKQLERDDSCSFTALRLAWASKSNCEQRKGRAGRVQSGTVYRMVQHKFYENLQEQGVPEILRIPLHQTILKVKKLAIAGTIYDILKDAIDPPNPEEIKRSVLELMEAGALKHPDYPETIDGDLTTFGEIMAQLPLDIALSRLIILAACFSCVDEGIIIAACLSSRNFMDAGFQKDNEKYRIKACLSEGKNCDLLAALRLYRTWETLKNGNYGFASAEEERTWCSQYCISQYRINEVSLQVSELKTRIDSFNIVFPLGSNTRRSAGGWDQRPEYVDQSVLLQFVIAGAFYPHYFFAKSSISRLHDYNLNVEDLKSVEMRTQGVTEADICKISVKGFFHKSIGFEPADVSIGNGSISVKFRDDEWRSEVPLPVRMALKLRDDKDMKFVVAPVSIRSSHNFHPRSVIINPGPPAQPPPTKSATKAFEISWPTSQYEIKGFTGMTNDVGRHHVLVNRSSINSIPINTAKDRRLSRLLVAASVRANTNNTLFLDYTSLMPPVPGFAEWVLLVFTPSVKLTMDESKRFCIGIRGGLGKCLKKKSTLWPKHDFTHLFDVKLDRNQIRLAKLMRLTLDWCFADHLMKCPEKRRVVLPMFQKNLLDQVTEMMTCGLVYEQLKPGARENEINMEDVDLTWDDEDDSD